MPALEESLSCDEPTRTPMFRKVPDQVDNADYR